MANIISVVQGGKIIAVNRASEKLLGYSKKILLTKNLKDIFNKEDRGFAQMRKQREIAGHATGNLIAVKKNGKTFPCQITSVIFTGDNHIEKAITTLVDRREGILRQKQIDLKKEKKAADEIVTALSRSDATLTRLDVLEHKLDKEITAKEQSQSSSRIQQRLFKKEWKAETRLKEIQIEDAVSEAKEVERSDLGKELHDNVNQLLAASRIYLDIGRRIEANRESNLNRSSEYTLSAIEEIRKLAKKLINNAVKNIGLCDAIHKMTQDLTEVYPIKINCAMDPEIHLRMNAKFNQDVFRIVQEQLNNIVKHAHASVVKID
ncbi:MAG TPA: PAS domain S-box protein, partial [Puia sp.]|nr:PAS domain S-box protein [Puia sp.]